MTEKTYPITFTPLEHVEVQKGKRNRNYLMFRASTETGSHVQERTIRVFGRNVEMMRKFLKKDQKVSGHVAYDSFKGTDGRHSQTMRLVSINSL